MSRLFIWLKKKPRLIYFAEDHPKVVVCDGQIFRDTGYGGWTGFYDWLRAAEEEIIGVRYSPFSDADFPGQVLELGAMIQLVDLDRLLLFFSDNRKYVPEISNDQDFEECSLFCSATGSYALLFGCSYLTVKERSGLRALISRTQAKLM